MRLTWIAAAVIGFSSQAYAGLEQDLALCAAQGDKLDRLICYDKLAAGVAKPGRQAPRGVAVQAMPPASAAPVATAVTTTAEAEFGIHRKPVELDVDKLYLEITSVKKDLYGNLTLNFTNGQVWKQVETRHYKLKAGDTVFIEKGALGSFLLGSDDRNATIRVKRLK
ncbi:hypothetical protein LZP73_06910 [Shewanella sp. AS16]|uniref:hypothetical protein n=1 Tax=Shewanella sp. AS16 TaxID=2907625 RepID=UPI001F1DE276|nr:hypothetical protein [Shewanella sp. AS16]MCE9685949.1 hypothetical protein [Shewanella sp. AS16]